MIVLGISCFFHDAAACLLKDGKVVAAASEERFTRIKHDPSFPVNAVRFCLDHGRVLIDEVDYVAFYDKPFQKFDRILTTYFANFPKSLKAFQKAMPQWLKKKLWMRDLMEREIYYTGPVLFSDHHLSHAASAFLVSPFEKAAILTIDGVGEWDTATFGIGQGNKIQLLKELRFPHSLGLLYNAFTYYLGFKVSRDEYKVMGLAPYGHPDFVSQIRQLIDLREDGSFQLNLKYFSFQYGLKMVNKKFENLFGGPRRSPSSPLEQRHKDIAASVQKMAEEIILKMVNHLHDEVKVENLCIAGGVGLNSVANGRVLRESPFENIFIQPAAGDAGGALGAACFVYNSLLNNPRNYVMKNAYLGPEFNNNEIALFLRNENIPFKELENSGLVQTVAKYIADGKVIGWYQGRMEFGPRALGNRSILADPRNPDMKDILNKKIKFREDFRPFAPAVLEERVSDYFELEKSSPYMLLVAQVKKEKRDEIPSVTHVDGSARIQTVNRIQNALFYALIKEFEQITGCAVIINTSFNVRGEPIVCTPREAFDCFQKTDMDFLVMGNYVIDKRKMLKSFVPSENPPIDVTEPMFI